MLILMRFMTIVLLTIAVSESGCYFFRKRDIVDSGESSGVVGESLGPRAGGPNEAGLFELHSILTDHPPAGIRPDPDLLVRQLLLQYREEGKIVAREINRVEGYRLLLGGASHDFTISPQEGYDATSLLAKIKVAHEICEGLVAPSASRHPGWETILPASSGQVESNVRFLVQRIVGLPSNRIPSSMVESLIRIMNHSTTGSNYEWSSYIPVCATLLVDAGALLL